MSDPIDYKALYLQSVERRKKIEEETKRIEEATKRIDEATAKKAEEAEKPTRKTNFEELIRSCHGLFSRPLRAALPTNSTKTGIIPPPPTGKICPLRLRPWTDCAAIQQEIYNSVYRYLQPVGKDAPRLFKPLKVLEYDAQYFGSRSFSTARYLKSYERSAVEAHVYQIISELCKIRQAQDEFRLRDGLLFNLHANTLDDGDDDEDLSGSRPFGTYQNCIHRFGINDGPVLATVQYKLPHTLSVGTLRDGLYELTRKDFNWEILERTTIPADGPNKILDDAMRITVSAIVQVYHEMIQEGLEYSYLTTGLGNLQLHVPFDDPGTLYYDLGEPNLDVDTETWGCLGSKTEIGRVLCLCLMSFRSQLRSHAWRNAARAQLRTWKKTSGQIVSGNESGQKPDTPPDPTSTVLDLDSKNYSAASTSQCEHRPHSYEFCTQRCLLGLQQGGVLDAHCPNVKFHQPGDHENRHQISVQDLVRILKQQLDENLDQECTPMGHCGSHSAPFKVTCAAYGYTVVAKGTTSRLWEKVSREIDIYRILQRVQGSAVPVFLGKIDLAMIYFLHDAGEIRHMLLMGWGGESTEKFQCDKSVQLAVSRAREEIRSLGILHQDLRPAHILWNTELQKALIIDFHLCRLDQRPRHMRSKPSKRQSHKLERQKPKRRRIGSLLARQI